MRILVVDDDESTAQILETLLAHHHYAVEIATDGESAWCLIEAFSYDLIVLDVILPGLDGLSLCQRLRNHHYNMPILLLTARDTCHDKALGLDAGADDYVTKPFDPEELTARIRALLRRGMAEASPLLSWGKLLLDPESYEVFYDQHPVMFTPKEYALLELLMRHPHRVFSCSMIIEHLWTYEDTPGDEAVRTHIKCIRQKLKAAQAPSHVIETVYGIGYRLHPQEESLGKTESSRIKGKGSNSDTERAASLQAIAQIAQVWERFQPRIHEQAQRLERAIALLPHGPLEPTAFQQAQRDAHSLCGALGTFGLMSASHLAREIETGLETAQSEALAGTSSHAMQQLHQGATELLHQLEHKIKNSVTSSSISGKQELSEPLSTDLATTNAPSTNPPIIAQATIAQATPYQPNNLPTAPAFPNENTEGRILIVDDDLKILKFLRTLLEPWGLQVITLSDPRRFWEGLTHANPDLLILNIQMSRMDGLELCQQIRGEEPWNSLPILLLTTRIDTETATQVFAAGADDFVSKPIIGPELIVRVLNRLERTKLLKRLMRNQPPTPDSIGFRSGSSSQQSASAQIKLSS